AAGNPECTHGNTEYAEETCTKKGKHGENSKRDQRSPYGDMTALRPGHSDRQSEKDRGKPRWIERHDQGCEGIDQCVCACHITSNHARSLRTSSKLVRTARRPREGHLRYKPSREPPLPFRTSSKAVHNCPENWRSEQLSA